MHGIHQIGHALPGMQPRSMYSARVTVGAAAAWLVLHRWKAFTQVEGTSADKSAAEWQQQQTSAPGRGGQGPHQSTMPKLRPQHKQSLSAHHWANKAKPGVRHML
jgi:hypothetical protein